MAVILGVDLGTTNSVKAVYERGAPKVIASGDDQRSPTTPTVIAQTEGGGVIVGGPARWQAQTNPEFTFSSLKRILGRQFEEPIVAAQAAWAPYKLAPAPEGQAWVRGRDGLQSPEALLALVLRKLKSEAEAHFGRPIGDCVLTAPAHFGVAQKAALTAAAEQAGLRVRRLLPEPSAAALAYGYDRGANKTIAVFDFGGGTFDVSILRVKGARFDILATAGDPFLGGDDVDRRIAERLHGNFERATGRSLAGDAFQLQRLRDEAEKAKIALSAMDSYTAAIPFVAMDLDARRQIDLVDTLTRADLESMVADLIERCRAPCLEALEKARLDPRDLDEVVLVGGMTAMPAIRTLVKDVFGREPRKDVPPEQVVAMGAALYAAALQGEISSLSLSEPLQHSLGLEDAQGRFVAILKAGTMQPARRAVRFTTSQDDQSMVAVRLYDGDLAAARDNRALGVIILDGIAPAPAGQPVIEVEFDLDGDGVLTAHAKDLASEALVSAQVHVATGLEATAARALAAENL
jgi:molecular chaperone DnaK